MLLPGRHDAAPFSQPRTSLVRPKTSPGRHGSWSASTREMTDLVLSWCNCFPGVGVGTKRALDDFLEVA